MSFLHGKHALIVGIASQRSIAWGIAKARCSAREHSLPSTSVSGITSKKRPCIRLEHNVLGMTGT